jgi:Domain of unknown function (DUF4145)
MNWRNAEKITSKDYKCGYCAANLASEKGYTALSSSNSYIGRIYICHKCNKPTYFDNSNSQTPGPTIGNPVKYIPDEDIEKLFNEAKSCFSISAYTSTVMCCRKLLMNISVSEGAKEGKNFTDYVNYLNDNNYIPPNGKKWVDSIRKLGNEANHKIKFKTQKEAERILNFIEMLLRFIYELPGIMEDSEAE